MTPQEYDAEEARAIARLPAELVAAMRPVAFESYAQDWCRRVERLDELGPWVDCMHEGTARIWNNLGGLTPNELAAVETVAAIAERRSAAIGCKRRPRDSLLQAVIPWRYVRTLMPRSARIFEIGPGSGYLGALLRMDHYRHVGTEITQPFFLWQAQLWAHWSDDHRPWWAWGCVLEGIWPADLIVACHMLNEMSEAALRLLIVSARCPILVEGWGSQGVRRTGYSMGLFSAAGWKRARLAEGDAASNHTVDLLLPPGDARSVGLDQALKVLG